MKSYFWLLKYYFGQYTIKKKNGLLRIILAIFNDYFGQYIIEKLSWITKHIKIQKFRNPINKQK